MLYFIVVESPPSFFGRSSIFAVFQVMVVVFRLLLQGRYKKARNIIRILSYESLWKKRIQKIAKTFTDELESIERILRQIELSLIAGDHESYKTSASSKKTNRSSCQLDKEIAKHKCHCVVCSYPSKCDRCYKYEDEVELDAERWPVYRWNHHVFLREYDD